jgi:CDP-diacylglycerol---serine O-phosphatidyltransferase
MADPKKRKHFSMLRSFALADFITLANGAAGTIAIFLCIAYVDQRDRALMWGAIALFPVALVCDVLDGSVARWRRKHSALGADLDSLADVVSFGVGPAVAGFALGLNGLWDSVILVFFVACGISRLARFNATAASMSTAKGKVSHYEGTPIPTSLLLVLVLAIAFGMNRVGDNIWLGVLTIGPWQFHPLVLIYLASGSAMISATLRIPKP